MTISRKRAAEMGAEAVEIIEEEGYRTAAGEPVEIGSEIERARVSTVSYPPDRELPRPDPVRRATLVEVENATTLAVAHRLVDAGDRPAALNFASAMTPGGGFMLGARAQEESLCWSSALFACLIGNDMYEYHFDRGDNLYSDYVIYSPDVPVFRDDTGALLSAAYLCSFLTSPAVNKRSVLRDDPTREEETRTAMQSRIDKVLAVAAHHGHASLVLGAWGCGVFGNDARLVATLFRNALAGPYRGVFNHVIFAVLDRSAVQETISVFREVLGCPGQ